MHVCVEFLVIIFEVDFEFILINLLKYFNLTNSRKIKNQYLDKMLIIFFFLRFLNSEKKFRDSSVNFMKLFKKSPDQPQLS